MQLRNIATEAELDELIEASKTAPVLLFKHSNTCSVSARASGQIDRFLSSEHATPFTAAVVVVQTARSLSDRIEERFGIRHESPQAIVLRDGKPVWSASHWDVTEARLAGAVGRG
jgi:bacillithiol system protein YtxJ